MRLHCPECQHQIPAEDVNIVKTIAKCVECNNIFEFTDQLKNAKLPATSFDQREEIMMPAGIEVLKLVNELEIMVRWRKSSKNFLIFFCLFWNSIVAVVTLAFAFSGSLFSFLILTPFWLVGILLIYQSIGYLLNTTYITVDRNRIAIEHKPINFLVQRDAYYHAKDVKQLFVQRYSVGSSNGQPVYAFALHLRLNNGKDIKLLKNLHSAEYAKYIEQEVERFLGLSDQKMEGEWN